MGNKKKKKSQKKGKTSSSAPKKEVAKKEEKPAPMTAEEKAAEKAKNRKTTRNIVLGTVILILVLVFISIRYIVQSYYYAFVLRTEDTIEEAMANNDSLSFSDEEEEELYELQAEWDSYSNSRLRDTVTVEAEDGAELCGYFFDNDSDVTVIGLHKYDSSGTDDFLYAEYFSEYNILLPDSRLHGSSGGDACTFGYLEAYDLQCWLEWVEENLGDQTIILVGENMGATTALIADELGLLEEYDIAFLLADSPYSSLKELGEYTLWHCYYIPTVLTWVLEAYSNNQDAGFRISDADALTNASEGSIPVLFLIGSENEYVPADETEALAEAWGGETEVYSCSSRNGLIYAENTEEIQSELDHLIETYVE